MKALVRGIVAASIVAIALTGCSSKIGNKSETPAPTETAAAAISMPVPDYVGMAGDEARDAAQALGYVVDWDAGDKTVIMSSNWTVDAQTPAAGAELEVGGTLTLHVSKHDEPQAADPAPAPAPAPAVEATSGGLDFAGATVACDHIGKANFPYGFKAHWIIGLINSELSNDQWFLKVETTVTNAYNAEADIVVECTVGGSEDAPSVTEFNAY